MDAATGRPDYWDTRAAEFDSEPDHGLLDDDVRAAWNELFRSVLTPGREIADLGCGTGSLTVLLAQAGHTVTGVDFAPRMIGAAREKARVAGVDATFLVGDAAAPPLTSASVDVVLVRHVLWAMPDRGAAVGAWIDLVRPGGSLVLVEGAWWNGVGLTARECVELVAPVVNQVDVVTLADPQLWGGPIRDERYLVVGRIG